MIRSSPRGGRGGRDPARRGAVEDPLDRGSDHREKRALQHCAVIDHVDVDDRRGAEIDKTVLVLDRARRQQGRGRRWRHGKNHRVGIDRAAVGDHTPTGRCFRQLTDLHTGPDLRPDISEFRRGGLAVQPLEGDVGPADVPGVRPLKQTGTHDGGGQAQ